MRRRVHPASTSTAYCDLSDELVLGGDKGTLYLESARPVTDSADPSRLGWEVTWESGETGLAYVVCRDTAAAARLP